MSQSYLRWGGRQHTQIAEVQQIWVCRIEFNCKSSGKKTAKGCDWLWLSSPRAAARWSRSTASPRMSTGPTCKVQARGFKLCRGAGIKGDWPWWLPLMTVPQPNVILRCIAPPLWGLTHPRYPRNSVLLSFRAVRAVGEGKAMATSLDRGRCAQFKFTSLLIQL